MMMISVFLHMHGSKTKDFWPLLISQFFANDTYMANCFLLTKKTRKYEEFMCRFSSLYSSSLLIKWRRECSSLKLVQKYSPLNLVPIGSPALLINTQALSANFMVEPSGLWYFFFVRTTTACRISPLLTFCAVSISVEEEPERCFCTTMTIRSPIRAWRFMPRTLAHSTMAAPELSMQFRRVWFGGAG